MWVLPPVVTAVIGAWRIDRAAMWADELATWGAVRLEWDQLWRLAGTVDAVITPYYAALKVFGTDDLRLPSLVATVLTSVVIVALGRRAGGDTAGMIAGLLFAVLPVTARYAQEARPYAIAVLFASLALLTLLRLLDRPRPGRAAVYAAAVAVTGLCHPFSALLMLAGHTLAGWRAWRVWPVAALAGALPAIGLFVVAAGQRGQVSWIGLVSLDTLRLLPDQFFLSGITGGLLLALAVIATRHIGLSLPRTTGPTTGPSAEPSTEPTAEPSAGPSTEPTTGRTAEPSAGCAAEPSAGSATSAGLGWTVLALAGAGLVPPVLLLAAGTVVHVWVARYVLIALPALVVLAAVTAVRAGRAPAVAVVTLIAVLGWPGQVDMREPDGHGQSSDRIADVIPAYYLDGDVAVFPDTHGSIPWAARDLYERYVPLPRPPDVLAVTRQRTDGRLTATECTDPAACLGAPPRIWIVRTDNDPDPLRGMSPAKQVLIGTDYRLRYRWNFLQLSVILMDRRER